MSKKISEVKPCGMPKEVHEKVEKQNNVTEIVFILDNLTISVSSKKLSGISTSSLISIFSK